MIYEDTKELLQKTEEIVLKIRKNKYWLFNCIDKILHHNTVGFIDVKENYTVIIKTLVIFIVYFVLVAFACKTTESLVFNGIFAVLIATIFAPLTVPTRIFGSDIKSANVKILQEEIIKKKLSPSQIQTIKNNLSILEVAFDAKFKIPRWIIVTLWAAWVYLFTQSVILGILVKNTVKLQTLLCFCICALIIGVIYLLTVAFQKTGKRIFMTLLFALNESIAEGKDENKK